MCLIFDISASLNVGSATIDSSSLSLSGSASGAGAGVCAGAGFGFGTGFVGSICWIRFIVASACSCVVFNLSIASTWLFIASSFCAFIAGLVSS